MCLTSTKILLYIVGSLYFKFWFIHVYNGRIIDIELFDALFNCIDALGQIKEFYVDIKLLGQMLATSCVLK